MQSLERSSRSSNQRLRPYPPWIGEGQVEHEVPRAEKQTARGSAGDYGAAKHSWASPRGTKEKSWAHIIGARNQWGSGGQSRESQHALGETTRQGWQGPCLTETHGFTLQCTKHEYKGPNKEFEGEIEQSNKGIKRGKRERSASNLGWGLFGTA